MKGFFRWFKNEAKMKRWMILLILGIIFSSYGMSKLLVTKEISFNEVGTIALIFIVGFTMVILSIVFMQKRTLEILVKESDIRHQGENRQQVKSLIFNKKVYSQGPKIVVIGGGSGLNTVVKGLKKYTDNITAIVTVSDYGEKATNSREMLGALPLEDIKDSFISLSRNETAMQNLMNYNFENGKLKSLSFGDIYFLAMQNILGNFAEAIDASKDILNITGRVLPVTLEEIKICIELEDGTVLQNRKEISNRINEKISKVERVFIRPSNCRPAPGVLEAIKEADAIIIGPGSLYTNVIPNLLVKGVSKEIKESKAFKIYISNIMTEPGQTDNYSLSDYLEAIISHAGKGIIDYCIYDTGEIVPEFVRKYNMEGAEFVIQDISKAKTYGVNLMQRDLSYIDGEYIRHNPDAIATSIIELICDDLKFRDKQNDAQYIMLNNRLKSEKKILKKNKRKIPKEKKDIIKGKSKFISKYQERIKSIQESDKKLKIKEEKNRNQINK